MQYKPPSLKKKNSSNQQDCKPPLAKPPGYHIVARNSNFRGTYTLDENSPERPNYTYAQSSNPTGKIESRRGKAAIVPKSFSEGRMVPRTSATPARELPGTVSEPGAARQTNREGGRGGVFSDEKERRHKRSLLKTPQPVAASYGSNQLSNGYDDRGSGARVGPVRQIRGNADNDGNSHFSSSSSLGDGEPPRLAPVKPKGKSRR